MEYSGGLSALGFSWQLGPRVWNFLLIFMDSFLPLILGFSLIYRMWSSRILSRVQLTRLTFLTH